MKLNNQVAIIVGGASGIGEATCSLFAQQGAQVVVADINANGAQRVADQIISAGGKAVAIAADATDRPQVAKLIEATLASFGRIDILVNSLVIVTGNDLLSTNDEQWNKDTDVAMRAVFLTMQAVMPQMLAQKKGAIVNIASVNAIGAYGNLAYSAGKAGVVNMTKNVALNYGLQGVRANVICPGTVRTPIWNSRLNENPQILDEIARFYPLGRVGEAQDIANAALFLASDDAAWITGAELMVDGGLTAGNFRMTTDLTEIDERKKK